jgi:ABC-type Na+ efflux pump permease subunit
LSDRPVRSRLTVSKRDLSALSREKTIVLALLIQLFVAAFSSFLVVGLTSLYAPGSVEGGEVTVAVVGDASDEFVDAASEVEGLTVSEYDSLDTATGAFEVDRAQAIVETRNEDGQIRVTATAPASSLRKTVVVVRLREALEVLERTERVERSANVERELVPIPPVVDASPYLGFSYTVLVPLLLFLPVFISGSVAVDSITEEVERGTLELLRVSPLSLTEIVEGKGLAAAALAPAQALLWVTLLSVNGIPVSNVPSVVVFVAALSVLVVGAGVGVALAVPDRQRAQLLYSLGILGAFASGAFLPEPPATTAARLAIDSPAPSTIPSVAGYAVAALLVVVGLRLFVERLDPKSL